jgi:hypothetical protein
MYLLDKYFYHTYRKILTGMYCKKATTSHNLDTKRDDEPEIFYGEASLHNFYEIKEKLLGMTGYNMGCSQIDVDNIGFFMDRPWQEINQMLARPMPETIRNVIKTEIYDKYKDPDPRIHLLNDPHHKNAKVMEVIDYRAKLGDGNRTNSAELA